jgi:hypothetical protein
MTPSIDRLTTELQRHTLRFSLSTRPLLPLFHIDHPGLSMVWSWFDQLLWLNFQHWALHEFTLHSPGEHQHPYHHSVQILTPVPAFIECLVISSATIWPTAISVCWIPGILCHHINNSSFHCSHISTLLLYFQIFVFQAIILSFWFNTTCHINIMKCADLESNIGFWNVLTVRVVCIFTVFSSSTTMNTNYLHYNVLQTPLVHVLRVSCGGVQKYFLGPVAGLTNQPLVRLSIPGTPLPVRSVPSGLQQLSC